MSALENYLVDLLTLKCMPTLNDPAILFLIMYHNRNMNISMPKDTNKTDTAALCIRTPNWGQPKCPSTQ